jgi:hypothetical protein
MTQIKRPLVNSTAITQNTNSNIANKINLLNKTNQKPNNNPTKIILKPIPNEDKTKETQNHLIQEEPNDKEIIPTIEVIQPQEEIHPPVPQTTNPIDKEKLMKRITSAKFNKGSSQAKVLTDKKSEKIMGMAEMLQSRLNPSIRPETRELNKIFDDNKSKKSFNLMNIDSDIQRVEDDRLILDDRQLKEVSPKKEIIDILLEKPTVRKSVRKIQKQNFLLDS